jgi:N-acetyl-anhydromuramyl-L-alanine amidase AmpD
MRPINLIVIHCAATPPDADIGREEIHQWHLARGWSGIGYHFVIRRNGDIEIGRDMERVGAHAQGHNSDSLGLCMVGGIDTYGNPEDNFTDAQYEALLSLVLALQIRHPQAKVLGHRDLPGVQKACPSIDAIAWWAQKKEAYIDAILDSARG